MKHKGKVTAVEKQHDGKIRVDVDCAKVDVRGTEIDRFDASIEVPIEHASSYWVARNVTVSIEPK